jgi:hypothetical protein
VAQFCVLSNPAQFAKHFVLLLCGALPAPDDETVLRVSLTASVYQCGVYVVPHVSKLVNASRKPHAAPKLERINRRQSVASLEVPKNLFTLCHCAASDLEQ